MEMIWYGKNSSAEAADRRSAWRTLDGDTSRSNAMGLAVIGCFVGGDISLIIVSYVKILQAVLRTPDGDRWKAFHTCGTSHTR
ncbi:hypothetical protein CRUP_036725 [Coryphaenoides rupestris]|nr:hypothetical protein CRUP_036725 [Coryphaenoides rupestris]